jgi:hypothetical protein
MVSYWMLLEGNCKNPQKLKLLYRWDIISELIKHCWNLFITIGIDIKIWRMHYSLNFSSMLTDPFIIF